MCSSFLWRVECGQSRRTNYLLSPRGSPEEKGGGGIAISLIAVVRLCLAYRGS